LTTYENALGQAINLNKSEVYFSKNTSQARHDQILHYNVMQMKVGDLIDEDTCNWNLIIAEQILNEVKFQQFYLRI